MRARAWRRVAELVLLVSIFAHALLCPFAKVEESFNLQAVHDMLVHRHDLASYDHNDFPGVVPRTFLGAAVLAAVSSPVHAVLEALLSAEPSSTRLASQIAVRLVLGLLCWLSFRRFNSAVALRFGDSPAGWAAAVWALQFHLPFYLSRTLPNVFALCVILLALQAWLRDDVPRTLGLFTLATVVFRCDVVVLLGPLTLQLLLTGRVRPLGVILTGLKWAIPSVLASVLLDSALWGRWVWPESQVLLFNTVDNRSSEWGEMPFYWYFVSALPRALSGTALLVPLGLLRDPTQPFEVFRRPAGAAAAAIDSQVFSYLLPGVAMVCLYSLLPHKELRFIFPALPLFNLAAGVGMSKAVRGVFYAGRKGRKGDDAEDGDDDDYGGGPERTRSNTRKKKVRQSTTHRRRRGGRHRPLGVAVQLLLAGVLAVACLATAGTTALALAASRANYPGGEALLALHRAIDADTRKSSKDVLVHLDAGAAMSGVSRFGQRAKGVSYSKQEEGVDFSKFDFVITEDPTKHRLLDLFEVRETIQGFHSISLRRFWKGANAAGEEGKQGGASVGGGGTTGGFIGGGIVAVTTRDQLYVMARWFPPPPREDLV
ncbi:unnamed protein product [Pylaiella littoralis]